MALTVCDQAMTRRAPAFSRYGFDLRLSLDALWILRRLIVIRRGAPNVTTWTQRRATRSDLTSTACLDARLVRSKASHTQTQTSTRRLNGRRTLSYEFQICSGLQIGSANQDASSNTSKIPRNIFQVLKWPSVVSRRPRTGMT